MPLPELLAPAGSFACAQAAFDHGADAVYAGIGRFNLRAHSPNFSIQEFAELVLYGAKLGRKVYGALNIMPDDQMLQEIRDTLQALSSAKGLPHAFIVSDPGVVAVVKETCPAVDLHLSTQTGCFNSSSMNFWRAQGISRIVLPRELSLDRIKELSLGDIVETEIFVHGAMCVSISGRCLLGAYLGKRHPNLGDCPQPCRFKYRIIPQEVGMENPQDGFLLEESQNGVYLLNSKDLCTLDILPDLVATGTASFKIEGRNKSAHYVASVVKVYREALDLYQKDPQNYKVQSWWLAELDSIEHRPYTTAFYGSDPLKQEVFSSKAQAGYRLVGTVKAVLEGRPVVDVKNSFSSSEKINVLPVRQQQAPFDILFDGIRNFEGHPMEKAPSNRLVILSGCDGKLRTGDMLRISI